MLLSWMRLILPCITTSLQLRKSLILSIAGLDTELVITGRHAPPEVLERADLITEMKAVKHYYKKGVKARVGIEK